MKKLFQIVFFVLYPLIIYSQETPLNENDSTPKQLVADTNHIEKQRNKNDTLKNTRIPNNSFYIELLGNAGLYSANYEKVFLNKKSFYLSGRIGGCFIPLNGYHDIKIVRIPVLINGFYQLNEIIFIEMGAGATIQYKHYYKAPPNPGSYVDEYKFAIVAFAGIRIQEDKGFIFRTGIFTPFPRSFHEDYFLSDVYFFPVGGISFGYTF